MTLILCCGNPLRGDEAVGWRVAEQLPAAEILAFVVACHALVPEFAPAIAAAEVVIFVDACASGTPGEVHCTRILPTNAPAAPQHGQTPASLLARANALYRGRPAGYLINSRGAVRDGRASLPPSLTRCLAPSRSSKRSRRRSPGRDHSPTPTFRGERPGHARTQAPCSFPRIHPAGRACVSVNSGPEARVQRAIVDKTPRGTGVAPEARVGAGFRWDHDEGTENDRR